MSSSDPVLLALPKFLAQVFKPGAAADILGVDVATLGYWRRASGLFSGKQGEKGWPRYTGRDLTAFAVIRDAQQIGLSQYIALALAEYAPAAMQEWADFLLGFDQRSDEEYTDFCIAAVLDLPELPDHPSEASQLKACLFTSARDFQEHISPHEDRSSGAAIPNTKILSMIVYDYRPTIALLMKNWIRKNDADEADQ